MVYLYLESLLSKLFKTSLIFEMCRIVRELHDLNGLPIQKYPKNNILLDHLWQNMTFFEKNKTNLEFGVECLFFLGGVF